MNAALVDSGSWALVILGVALAAASVRVAQSPNLSRIIALGATTVAIPLSLQIF
jgi:multisubunit Na+/H+ antiporter MnhF subunit